MTSTSPSPRETHLDRIVRGFESQDPILTAQAAHSMRWQLGLTHRQVLMLADQVGCDMQITHMLIRIGERTPS